MIRADLSGMLKEAMPCCSCLQQSRRPLTRLGIWHCLPWHVTSTRPALSAYKLQSSWSAASCAADEAEPAEAEAEEVQPAAQPAWGLKRQRKERKRKAAAMETLPSGEGELGNSSDSEPEPSDDELAPADSDAEDAGKSASSASGCVCTVPAVFTRLSQACDKRCFQQWSVGSRYVLSWHALAELMHSTHDWHLEPSTRLQTTRGGDAGALTLHQDTQHTGRQPARQASMVQSPAQTPQSDKAGRSCSRALTGWLHLPAGTADSIAVGSAVGAFTLSVIPSTPHAHKFPSVLYTGPSMAGSSQAGSRCR